MADDSGKFRAVKNELLNEMKEIVTAAVQTKTEVNKELSDMGNVSPSTSGLRKFKEELNSISKSSSIKDVVQGLSTSFAGIEKQITTSSATIKKDITGLTNDVKIDFKNIKINGLDVIQNKIKNALSIAQSNGKDIGGNASTAIAKSIVEYEKYVQKLQQLKENEQKLLKQGNGASSSNFVSNYQQQVAVMQQLVKLSQDFKLQTGGNIKLNFNNADIQSMMSLLESASQQAKKTKDDINNISKGSGGGTHKELSELEKAIKTVDTAITNAETKIKTAFGNNTFNVSGMTTQLNTLKTAMKNATTMDEFTTAKAKLNIYVSEMGKASKEVQNFQKLMNQGSAFKSSVWDDYIKQGQELITQFNQGNISAEKFTQSMKNLTSSSQMGNKGFQNTANVVKDVGKNIDVAEQKLREYISNLAGINTGDVQIKQTADGLKAVATSAKDASGKATTFSASWSSVDGVIRNIGSSTKQASTGMKILNSTFGDVISQMGMMISTYRIMSAVINGIKDGFEFVKDMDYSLTTISMTMDTTASSLEQLGSSSITMAQDMGTSVSEVMNVAQIYANANETVESILKKTQPTLKLSNASGMDTSTASDVIQGVTHQFTELAGQEDYIVDVLENISSEMAVDFGVGIQGMSEAIQVSGQIAQTAGMDLETYASMVGVIEEVTRQSGSTIGNAWKTIFSRVARVTDGSEEKLSESEVSKVATAYKSVGISVYSADGQFQNMMVTLDELHGKWNSLTDAQKNYINMVYITYVIYKIWYIYFVSCIGNYIL